MHHIKQLDSLRTIAVFLVIISHWVSKSTFVVSAHLGQMGVNMFFVLSGFLITTILLKNRIVAGDIGSSKTGIVKGFFLRRSLRIFPIYYLTIFVLFLFNNEARNALQKSLAYYLTYTINFRFYSQGGWDDLLSHFWSLAVEEQFYLIWPWIILFIPKRQLPYSIIIFIIIGVTSNFLFDPKGLGFTLPFACFDAFGLGALFSYMLVFHKEYLSKFYQACSIAAILCSIMLVGAFFWSLENILPLRTIQSIIALWIITYIIYKRETGKTKFFLLDNRVLVFLGKISYGMYLYHLPLVYDSDFLYRHIPDILQDYYVSVIFLENLFLLIALSWLSWTLIERPILKLKKYITYQTPQKATMV